ncbi:DNA sulfur modification protein DndB [Dactylosporangium sp. NPDC049525]|uniref:DNA sulfur modification protein DndB n=1 Tax=Dactylosporangium sp. NPDC049525 TaxID=3154730 RepID=UPI0034316CC0
MDEHKLQTVMTVAALRQAVIEPTDLENPKILAGDSRKRLAADVRSKVQRSVTNAKKANVASYGQYILEGFRQERKDWDVPTMPLFREQALELYALPDGKGIGFLLKPGDFLVNTDGETQRLAWAWASSRESAIDQVKVAVTIVHGKPVGWARQVFHDFNLLGVRPNVAIGISMDSSDFATRIARELEERSSVLRGRVMQTGRQLGRNSPELVTVSALRSAVVTSLLGRPGLSLGAKPVAEKLGRVDENAVAAAVMDVWLPLLEMLQPEFLHRNETVVSSPVIMAALGAMVHHALPNPPRSLQTPALSRQAILDKLSDVCWNKEAKRPGKDAYSPWEGVAGKTAPSGIFSIGGIKEYGHAVIEALSDETSDGGRKIRLLSQKNESE